MYVYYKRTRQHEQSTCGVLTKKHTQHTFFIFFPLSFRARERQKRAINQREDQGNHHEKTTTFRREGRPRIEDNFFFTDAPNSIPFSSILKRSALARGNLQITTRKTLRARALHSHTHAHVYTYILFQSVR